MLAFLQESVPEQLFESLHTEPVKLRQASVPTQQASSHATSHETVTVSPLPLTYVEYPSTQSTISSGAQEVGAWRRRPSFSERMPTFTSDRYPSAAPSTSVESATYS